MTMLVQEISTGYAPALIDGNLYPAPAAERPQLRCSLDGFNAFMAITEWNDKDIRERFYCLYLNRANRLIGFRCISVGGVSGTVADIKLMLQPALQMRCPASSMMVAHNHPSGNGRPSDADISLTRKLIGACRTMDIAMLDHIIILGDGTEKTPVPGQKYYSFADEGMLNA